MPRAPDLCPQSLQHKTWLHLRDTVGECQIAQMWQEDIDDEINKFQTRLVQQYESECTKQVDRACFHVLSVAILWKDRQNGIIRQLQMYPGGAGFHLLVPQVMYEVWAAYDDPYEVGSCQSTHDRSSVERARFIRQELLCVQMQVAMTLGLL
jgi:hypothetical protein